MNADYDMPPRISSVSVLLCGVSEYLERHTDHMALSPNRLKLYWRQAIIETLDAVREHFGEYAYESARRRVRVRLRQHQRDTEFLQSLDRAAEDAS